MSDDWKDPDPGDTRLQAAMETVTVGVGSLTEALIILQRELSDPLIRSGIDPQITWVSQVLPSIIRSAGELDRSSRRRERESHNAS